MSSYGGIIPNATVGEKVLIMPAAAPKGRPWFVAKDDHARSLVVPDRTCFDVVGKGRGYLRRTAAKLAFGSVDIPLTDLVGWEAQVRHIPA